MTDSGQRALLLEINLVSLRPRYNVRLKDDKSYPFIKITLPRISRGLNGRAAPADGTRYSGRTPRRAAWTRR